MITHEEAKNIIELSFNEYITVLLKLGLSVKLIERWKEDLIEYISQQEKKDELLCVNQLIWKLQNQDELTISAYTYEDLIELISKKEKLETELGETK